MEKVRLLLWDSRDRQCGEVVFSGATILDAATAAVVCGMASDMDFSVVENPPASLKLYWCGRKPQKVAREEVRAMLRARKVD